MQRTSAYICLSLAFAVGIGQTAHAQTAQRAAVQQPADSTMAIMGEWVQPDRGCAGNAAFPVSFVFDGIQQNRLLTGRWNLGCVNIAGAFAEGAVKGPRAEFFDGKTVTVLFGENGQNGKYVLTFNPANMTLTGKLTTKSGAVFDMDMKPATN